jgi:hypothetical protein
LKGQADDTKSPRERQFILQIIGIRIVIVLIVLGGIFGIEKISSQALVSDITLAVFIFLVAVMGTVLVEYTNRRQRQLQIEEGTWVETEWKVPRKKDESLLGLARKLKNYIRTARFKGFIFMLVAMALMQKLWKDLGAALPLLIVWPLCLFLDFNNWQNSPRYKMQGVNSSVGIVLMCGLITLLEYNFSRYISQILTLTGSRVNTSNISSPAVAITFNLVVVLVYAIFIAVLIWKRKKNDGQNSKTV